MRKATLFILLAMALMSLGAAPAAQPDCGVDHKPACTPTPTATFLPTATSIPTDTPTPTATATAIATSTPTATPSGAIPLCPTHDPTQWHALYDAARNCHYDHTHNADPDDPAIDAALGPADTYRAGQTISYPWNTSPKENVDKHGGYKFAVRSNMPCVVYIDSGGLGPQNCITDARIEYHVVSHAMDSLARYHSFYAELRICQQPAFTQCGIMRYGGWADFGLFIVPYISFRVVRPAAVLDFGMGSLYGGGNVEQIETYPGDTPDLDAQTLSENSHYVAMSALTPALLAAAQGSVPTVFDSYAKDAWSTSRLDLTPFGPAQEPYMHNPYLRFIAVVMDSWNLVDPQNPTAISWLCRDGSCPYNGSLQGLPAIAANVLAKFDPNGTGFADYNGFTDRNGLEVTGCTAPSLDCVPFILQHAPVGFAFKPPARQCNCGPEDIFEFDTSPAGQHFIQFPN